MNRRSLFARLGAAAAVVAVAPAVEAVRAVPETINFEKMLAERMAALWLSSDAGQRAIIERAVELTSQESPPTMQAAMHGLPSPADHRSPTG